MDFKNLAENLLIAIVVALSAGVVGYFSSLKATEAAIVLLRPTIEEAIRKETKHITNEFKTEIGKLKAKKDAEVIIETNPDVESAITPNTSNRLTRSKRKRFNSKR